MRGGDVDQFVRFLGIREHDPSAQENVQTYVQRTMLAYIGWQVFLDHPIAGAGWQSSAKEEQVYGDYLDDARREFPDTPEGIPDAGAPVRDPERVCPGARRPRRDRLRALLATFAAGLFLAARVAVRGPPEALLPGVLAGAWLLLVMGTWTAVGLVACRSTPSPGSPSGRRPPRPERGSVVPEEAPGAEHRQPQKSRITYHVRAALAAWLQSEATRAHDDLGRYRARRRLRQKPYLRTSSRTPTSMSASTSATRRRTSRARWRPCRSRTAASTSCSARRCSSTSTSRPGRARARPRHVSGGRVLASTHGVQVYHPSPNDYWRWTHAGLERMFERSADWASVSVIPIGGAATCLAAMSAVYADLLFRKAHLAVFARDGVDAQLLGGLVDRAVPSLRADPGLALPQLHVVADKK